MEYKSEVTDPIITENSGELETPTFFKKDIQKIADEQIKKSSVSLSFVEILKETNTPTSTTEIKISKELDENKLHYVEVFDTDGEETIFSGFLFGRHFTVGYNFSSDDYLAVSYYQKALEFTKEPLNTSIEYEITIYELK